MHTAIRHDVLTYTLHLTTLVRPIVEGIARKDRELATQVRRATNSISLNLAEAFGTPCALRAPRGAELNCGTAEKNSTIVGL